MAQPNITPSDTPRRSVIAELIVWGGGLFIAAIFLDSLRFKFTGHPTPQHIFTTLREWSGIGLFYPAGPWIIGLGELAAALLLIAAPLALLLAGRRNLADLSQLAGALIALAIMSGAIIFHLFTPLGIQTPVAWQGATPTAFAPNLFIAACIAWVFALAIALLRKSSLKRR